jgi:hypothetical protein
MAEQERCTGRVLDLCCGGKRCAVLREIPNGFIIEDEGVSVTFTREQAEKITAWLVLCLNA